MENTISFKNFRFMSYHSFCTFRILTAGRQEVSHLLFVFGVIVEALDSTDNVFKLYFQQNVR